MENFQTPIEIQNLMDVTWTIHQTTDLAAEDLSWASDGGVDYSYSIRNSHLESPTSVGLYWARDTTFDAATAVPAYSTAAGTAVGSYGPFHVDAAALGTPPPGAKYLLVVADPPTAASPNGVVIEPDESNNVLPLAIPDIAVQSLSPSELGGVDFAYTVDNAPLPLGTTVGLYWARDTSFNTAIGGPAYSTAAGTAVGSYGPFHVDAAALGTPPPEAKYLLAVADPPTTAKPNGAMIESDKINNLAYMLLPDLSVEKLDWNTDVQKDAHLIPYRDTRGVDFQYQLAFADLPTETTLEFYWAQETLAGFVKIGGPLATYPVGKTQILSDILNEPARFGAPPVDVSDLHLIAEIDPSHKIVESDTSNNILDLTIATPREVLAGSVQPRIVNDKDGRPTIIEAIFSPGKGLITLSEAEVALGVDHFNWVQTIQALPAGWTAYTVKDLTSIKVPGPGIDEVLVPNLVADGLGGFVRYLTDADLRPVLDSKGRPIIDPSRPDVRKKETPFYDPIVPFAGSEFTETYTTAFLTPRGQVVWSLPENASSSWRDTPDGLPFYLNEGQAEEVQYFSAPNGNLGIGANQLLFSDQPNQPSGTILGGNLEFETRLVGVAYDGVNYQTWGEQLEGYLTNFRWKSNAQHDSQGSLIGDVRFITPGWGDSSSLYADRPAVVSGGISDIQLTDDFGRPASITIGPIADQQAIAGQTIQLTAIAVASTEGTALIYSLGNGAPAGTAIDPASGVFSWAIPAALAAGDYAITIVAADKATATLTASRTFVVHVSAANHPPAFAAAGPLTGEVNRTLVFAATATDPDPGQRLTYSLGKDAPSGAAIDPATGVVTFLPATDGTFSFTIRATDDGNPAGTASETVTVTVLPPLVTVASVGLATKRGLVTGITVRLSTPLPTGSALLAAFRLVKLVKKGQGKRAKTIETPVALKVPRPGPGGIVTLVPRKAFATLGATYQLRILGSALKDAQGRAVDADGDRTAGGEARYALGKKAVRIA